MADFIRRKLQVFVSSTYLDLKEERQAAVEAILAAGHIPAGMELFTAGDESQLEVIKQWIDESDVYVLILGARYGSIDALTGKSYTHIEYEYAFGQAKPLFACVMRESAIEKRAKSLEPGMYERENAEKLKAFRAQVLTKLSKFWEDPKDIKIAVTETLSLLAHRQQLTGWVRATPVALQYDELAHLREVLSECRAMRGAPDLLTILREVVQRCDGCRWKVGKEKEFMAAVTAMRRKPGEYEDAFWWLIVHGVFAYNQIDEFCSDSSTGWTKNIHLVQFSERGIALLQQLQMESTNKPVSR